jgi:hypothetical protein
MLERELRVTSGSAVVVAGGDAEQLARVTASERAAT